MRLLRDCVLPLTLGLILAPVTLAGDDEKSSGKKGTEQTIRGVISGVTVMGETDIDFATHKAITAEATYLTVIGHPWNPEEKSKGHEQASADKDRDVKRTAAGSSEDKAKSGERPKHRMNVYVVAVSPKTKVCECKQTGKEGSASIKEEACDLDKVEIGDRVEVSFNPNMDSRSSDEKKGESKVSTQKHGRHRTYFGAATAIKIIEEPTDNEHSSSQERK